MRRLCVMPLLGLALAGCGSGNDAASLARACEQQGNLQACTALGRLHFEGVGAPEDKDRAILLFDRACSGGDAGACANLNTVAALYESGAGVPRDSARAADLKRTACRGGVTVACAR